MPNFRIADLPDKTKTMHQTQARWRKRNWNDSLKNHGNELEELLSLIQLFDVWKNRLPSSLSERKSSLPLHRSGVTSVVLHFLHLGLLGH